MDSSLTLREIQDRLRSGSSVEDVAAEAGVAVEELQGYATPILAEREYITQVARGSNVRRAGDSPAPRDLDAVVNEELRARALDAREVSWDAARVERRRWQVIATLKTGETDRRAVFNYDVDGRYSVAGNEDARWMLGELPLPPLDQETEPTLELTEEHRRARQGAADEDDEDWADGPNEIDTLYDMLSSYAETISGYEDTINALRGYGEREAYHGPRLVHDSDTPEEDEDQPDEDDPEGQAPQEPPNSIPAPRPGDTSPAEGEGGAPTPRKRTSTKRARVPSWDEIIFGSGADGQDS